MTAEDAADPDSTPSRRSLVANLLYAVAAVLVAYLTTIISGLANDVANLSTELERFEADASVQIEDAEDAWRAEVARLDESNRNRRNSIADLEERIAAVEAFHPPGVDHAGEGDLCARL